MNENYGVNEFTLEELAELFKDEDTQTPPSEPDQTTPSATTPEPEKDKVEQTKAFAKRLSEMTEKKVTETREQVAKEAGYASYAEMIKAKEEKILSEKGLNPKDIAPVVDELVKERLNSDPRIKELEKLRKQNVLDYAKKEMAEITKLTGGEITKFEQLPKEVIEVWKQTGSLKSAFLQIKGEDLIIKANAANSKGSTDHLKNPDGTIPPAVKERLMTNEEKRIYKLFNPNITDEELNKKMKPVD